MKQDKFLLLLSKKLSGDISIEEIEQFNNAVNGSEEYKQTADKLSKYFNHHNNKNSKTDKLRNTWATIAKAEHTDFEGMYDYTAPKSNTKVLLKIAALLVVTLSMVLIGYQLLKNVEQEMNTVSTNQKSFTQLEDGTKVWLNKNSSIRYNTSFGKHKREISLKGEAYFDVVKNSAVPLFVHVGNIDIEVKGTAFNVDAYPTKPAIEVALIRGSIQISNKLDTTTKVLLHPNQKVIVSNTGVGKFIVMPVNELDLLGETKWTSDTLTFYKEKLKDLVIQLEKKYELKIEIQSAKLKEKRFSGTFINETLQQALAALKLSYPLTYTIDNKLVIIKD